MAARKRITFNAARRIFRIEWEMHSKAITAMLRLLADADSAASAESYRTELLAAVAAVLPCDLVVWNEFPIGGLRKPMGRTEPRDAITPALQALFAAQMLEHPLVRHYAAGDRTARRLSDATSSRAFHRFGLYYEFFQAARPRAPAHARSRGPPGYLIGISLNRARHDFADEELLLIELLRPHIEAGERP